MDEDMSPELRASVAILASMCRQRSSDGNIQVMGEVRAAREVGRALVGEDEWNRWEDWVVPRHIAITAALNGDSPPKRR